MPAPANPHDAFFKQALSRTETARDFLHEYLDPALLELLDLDTLTPAKDSFVDPDLREHFSDLLYEVARAGGGEGEPQTAFQVLKYVVRVWEAATRQQESLWPVLPVVLYHGADEWTAPLGMHALLNVPDPLRPFVPEYRYWLCDVGRLRDADIRGAPPLKTALWVLKAIFRDDVADRLPRLRQLLRELPHDTWAVELMTAVLTYILKAADRNRVGVQDLRNLAGGIPELEAAMPTIADEWIEQGMQKGLAKGREEGLQQAILGALEFRFGPVPPGIAEGVRQSAGLGTLRQLHSQALTAVSLDEFERILAKG